MEKFRFPKIRRRITESERPSRRVGFEVREYIRWRRENRKKLRNMGS